MVQINIGAGQNLQSAVDTAPAGSILALEAGATFLGPIVLPPDKPLTLQSSRFSELAPDKRVSPDDAGKMPKLIAPVGDRVIKTKARARECRLLGLEVTHDPTTDIHTLIALGDGDQTVLEDIPHTLTLDRMFIHGHADRASVRGIALNSAKTDILNTYISDIHSADVDSQAICGWAGPGPFRIINGYCEAAGENIMFGGADPKIAGLIPSDIEIRRCHVFKPLTWKVGHPTYAGRDWSIKNLFETKNARRLVVEGNVFENNWTDSQAGSGIVIKCNNQDSTAPWSVTEDLLFQHNIVISEAGLNMLLIENPPKVSAIGKRLYYRNNLFIVDRLAFQGPNSGEDVRIEHNTWIIKDGNIFVMYGRVTKGLKFNNNLGDYSGFGIRGDGEGVGANVPEGAATFNAYSPGTWTAEGNVIARANIGLYPPKNFYPPTWAEVKLGPDFKLAADSPYKGKATDGKDPGCDMDALLAAQQGTSEPPPPPDPVPVVTLTSPRNGETVSGQITVTATVTNAPIGDVYLLVDEATSGHLTAAPYEFKLDTSKLADGSHSIWVRAWNQTGQAGDGKINVTVKNVVVVPDPIPQGSRVQVIKRTDVHEAPSASSVVKSVAEIGEFGFTLSDLQLDPVSGSTFVQVDFIVGIDGFVLAQALKVDVSPPPQCLISAPASVSIPRNGTGVISVTLQNLSGPTVVNVLGSDGQVTVSPLSWNAGPTSTVKQFQIKVKKQSRTITFSSGCGIAVVKVNVS